MKSEDRVRYSILMDTYGSLLTKKQRELFSMYVNEDYSVVEIADMTGMTRQAVSDTTKTVVTKLMEYEDMLHIVSKNSRVNEKLDEMLSYSEDPRMKQDLEDIRKMLLED